MLKDSVFSYAARRLTGKAIERGLTERKLCVESIRKRSKSSLHVNMGISIFLLFVVANQTFAQDVGAEGYLSDDPIGGGPGYSDSVRHQDADYYVTDKSSLLNALANATSSDIIYVADWAEIDMSGEYNISIPAGVTLASGRGRIMGDTISWGGLIYTDTRGGYTLFKSTGEHARVTGLRFRGEFRDYRVGVVPDTFDPGTGLKFFEFWHDSFEVDNCEFCGYGNFAVMSLENDITFGCAHHNLFRNTIICVQGVPLYNGGGFNLFEANLFDYCRQNIASKGWEYASYEACYNIALQHTNTHSFDRHGYPSDGGDAGFRTFVHHNTSYQHGWATRGVKIRGTPIDSAIVCNNWFQYSTEDSSIRFWSNQNCVAYDNHYGTSIPDGLADRIPTALAQISPDSGAYPLRIICDGSGSSDPDGSIAWYEWDFGDNCATVRHELAEHTYEDIGVYLAELTVHDNNGCVAFDSVHINVTPPSTNSYYVSAWVNDRYCDADAGYFRKQIFLNDWKVWESSLAGYHGWEHIIVDVTDSIFAWQEDSITVTLRLYCTEDFAGQIPVVETWWDDVAFFWSDLKNGDFEQVTDGQSASHWTYAENETWFWGGIKSDDARSGTNSLYLKFQAGQSCNAGDWGQVSQKVGTSLIGIEEHDRGNENTKHVLHIPYPNPSTNRSTIAYTIAALSKVSLRIYDTSGRLVKTLADGMRDAGYYQLFWDGFDNKGFSTPNGVYFCRLEVIPDGEGDEYRATQKLVMLK